MRYTITILDAIIEYTGNDSLHASSVVNEFKFNNLKEAKAKKRHIRKELKLNADNRSYEHDLFLETNF